MVRITRNGYTSCKLIGVNTDRPLYSMTLMGKQALEIYVAVHGEPDLRERNNQAGKKQAAAKKKAKVVISKKEGVALPRTINIMAGIYVPPSGEYVRNNGNKHIQSRGF